jgi:hypothetical protein
MWFSYWNHENGQDINYYTLNMYAGYRYSFYVTTYYSYDSGFLWLALSDSDDNREYFGVDNCELCNWSGCVDMAYDRTDCPGPSPTPTLSPASTATPPRTFSPNPTPSPSSTPYSCGISGVLYSIHSEPAEENWVESDYASVYFYGLSSYVSIKGSYLCQSSGDYKWSIYPSEFYENWYLMLDGEKGCSDSCVLAFDNAYDFSLSSPYYYYNGSLISGYRYPFYFSTTMRSSFFISVDIYLEDQSSNNIILLGTQNTERCNTSYCNDLSASRYGECIPPHATATPEPAGKKGVLYTRHILGNAEDWKETSVAQFSGFSSSSRLLAVQGDIVGFSGSYLCTTNGTHEWSVSANDLYWRFKCGNVDVNEQEDSQSYDIDMFIGYRYAFRLLTVGPATSWSISISVRKPGGTIAVLSDGDCETAEIEGCVDASASIEEGCPLATSREEEGDSTPVRIGVVIGVLAVIGVVTVIVIIMRRKKGKGKPPTGEGEETGEAVPVDMMDASAE